MGMNIITIHHLECANKFDFLYIIRIYKMANVELSFEQFESCKYIFNKESFNKKLPVAGFDFDSTLIIPHNGKLAVSKSDFSLNLTKEFIRDLKETHNVVIFSNQSRFNSNTEFRFLSVMKDLNIDHCFVATKKDEYRKPETGMWNFMKNLLKNNLSSLEHFYVGDAGGRVNDFSDSDKLFAENIGIKFIHIDDYKKDKNSLISDEKSEKPEEKFRDYKFKFLKNKYQHIIIMVGAPASGKSTFCNFLIDNHNFEIASNDIQKTKAKVNKKIKEVLLAGSNLIIDNTNPKQETRQSYLDFIDEFEDERFENTNKKLKVSCIHMKTHKDECLRRNELRNEDKKVPKIAIYTFFKRFEEIDLSSFDYIYEINEFEIVCLKR